MTHFIKHLSFGQDYPGIINPLDGTNVEAPQGKCMSFLFFMHKLKIMPEVFQRMAEKIDLSRIKYLLHGHFLVSPPKTAERSLLKVNPT